MRFVILFLLLAGNIYADDFLNDVYRAPQTSLSGQPARTWDGRDPVSVFLEELSFVERHKNSSGGSGNRIWNRPTMPLWQLRVAEAYMLSIEAAFLSGFIQEAFAGFHRSPLEVAEVFTLLGGVSWLLYYLPQSLRLYSARGYDLFKDDAIVRALAIRRKLLRAGTPLPDYCEQRFQNLRSEIDRISRLEKSWRGKPLGNWCARRLQILNPYKEVVDFIWLTAVFSTSFILSPFHR